MKKLLIIPLLLMISCGNKNVWKAKIKGYDYAYQTSRVQEYTHDIYLALVGNEAAYSYIEVPEDYDNEYVPLTQTEHYYYYRVYGTDKLVSNNGWEYIYENWITLCCWKARYESV